MIRIGLNKTEKLREIESYISHNSIKKVFLFYPDKFPFCCDISVQNEHVKYTDIIMYKYFYRLLEEIGKDTLLVFNECLRTQNRSDLTYNCAHHYCNQTEHKIVFEYFPFIEASPDFMILLDFVNKGKYKGKSFDYQFLQDEDIQVKPIKISSSSIEIHITEKDRQKYEAKKEQLFDGLGNSDPDTIPRNLHIWAGNLKKSSIKPELNYIARNDRFKLSNVTTYKNADCSEYIVIDFPHRRLDFNDFLKLSGMTDINFIHSGLNVDKYYFDDFAEWIERLERFYAKASLYQQNGH